MFSASKNHDFEVHWRFCEPSGFLLLNAENPSEMIPKPLNVDDVFSSPFITGWTGVRGTYLALLIDVSFERDSAGMIPVGDAPATRKSYERG